MSAALSATSGFQRPQRLSDHAYDQLRALIISNRLAPGEAIGEERFASQWNISRTPLRDALVRLERDGLVQTLPHKGCIVAALTPHDVESVYQVREALEPKAVELATPAIPANRLDEIERLFAEIEIELARDCYEKYIPSDAIFHAVIHEFVPNAILTQMLARIYDQITRIRNFSNTQQGAHMRESFAEHASVLAAMRRRDAESANVAMRDHLRNVTRRTLSLLDHPTTA